MIQIVTSKENKVIKYVKKLKDNTSFSKKEGLFLVEGEHLLEMSLSQLEYVLTLKELDESKYKNQYIVNEEIMKKLSDAKSTPRCIGVCKVKKEEELTRNVILYLDDVQDPGNVGTILRTSLAFDIKDVILTKGCASIFNQKVIQSSQGAIFDLNIKNGDINDLLNLKVKGYQLVSTALNEKTIDLSSFEFIKSQKYVIILGNEGSGIKKQILDISDYSLKINIKNIDSLNVGVAAGIIMNKVSNS